MGRQRKQAEKHRYRDGSLQHKKAQRAPMQGAAESLVIFTRTTSLVRDGMKPITLVIVSGIAFLIGLSVGEYLAISRSKAAEVRARWRPESPSELAVAGVWVSEAPKGYRMTLTFTGECVVTQNGIPLGACGTWKLEKDRILIKWALYEELEEETSSFTYKLDANGGTLEIAPAFTLLPGAKRFLRAKS